MFCTTIHQIWYGFHGNSSLIALDDFFDGNRKLYLPRHITLFKKGCDDPKTKFIFAIAGFQYLNFLSNHRISVLKLS